MANYVACARSSYFMVKDPAAFEAFCKKWDARMIRGGDNDALFGLICGEEGGIPSSCYDAEKEEYVDGSFMDDLATHLADGWVAIVREIGFEKMHYLVGYTVAVNSRGESIEVSLDQIYEDAKRLGAYLTACEY